MLLMQYFSRLLLFFMPCCGILIFLFLHKPRISFDGCGVQTVPVVAVLRTLNPPGFSQRITMPR